MVSRAVLARKERTKKLIAALLLATDDIFGKAYDCDTCEDEFREKSGCGGGPCDVDMFSAGVWKIDFCLECYGKNPECTECKGSNSTPVWSCPRTMADACSNLLLPYFFEWWHNREAGWPFGNCAMSGQMKQLVSAFRVLSQQQHLIEERKNVK